MEKINDKERLIFYKRETPYFMESSITETQVEEGYIPIEDDEPETTSSITEDESGRTIVVVTTCDALHQTRTTITTTKIMVPIDVTKNCKLTAQDLDENFLTLKDHDIESGYYDSVNNTIHLVRNGSGLTDIVISLSGGTPEIQPDGEGGTEPGGEDEPTAVDTSVHASFSGDSAVILNWTDSDGIPHEVLVPIYKEEKPGIATQTPHIDKAVTKKPVLSIVNSIAEAENIYGNRYLLFKKASVKGYLYPGSAIAQIANKLLSEGLIWHIPSVSDFEILFSNQECIENKRGLALKALDSEWDGYDVLGFHALPTDLEEIEEEEFGTCSFITSDDCFIKLRTGEDDIISGSTDNSVSYSVRLVADASSSTIDLSDSIVNILGDDYQVKKIGSQYWISSNLNYDDGTAQTVGEYHAYLIQYNGHDWEQRQLSLGETIWMQDQNGFLGEYSIVYDGNECFLLSRFDAGWY